MAVAYPSTLPTAMRASKARTQAAPFSATDPSQGKLYVQRSGADNPVAWRVQFRFTQAQAQTFMEWFETGIQRGLLAFDLPIRTEFGIVTHTCRFLAQGLLDCQEDGRTFTYSATVVARELVMPDGYDEAGDLILDLPNWDQWAVLLDQAITQELPEA